MSTRTKIIIAVVAIVAISAAVYLFWWKPKKDAKAAPSSNPVKTPAAAPAASANPAQASLAVA